MSLLENIQQLEQWMDHVLEDSEKKDHRMSDLRRRMTEQEALAEQRKLDMEKELLQESREAIRRLQGIIQEMEEQHEVELSEREEIIQGLERERRAFREVIQEVRREAKQKIKRRVESTSAEVTMLKKQLEEQRFKLERQAAAEKDAALKQERQAIKWKEQYFQLKLFSEQKFKLLSERLSKMAIEQAKWKDKLVKQRELFEKEIGRKNAVLQRLKEEGFEVLEEDVHSQFSSLNSPRTGGSLLSSSGTPSLQGGTQQSTKFIMPAEVVEELEEMRSLMAKRDATFRALHDKVRRLEEETVQEKEEFEDVFVKTDVEIEELSTFLCQLEETLHGEVQDHAHRLDEKASIVDSLLHRVATLLGEDVGKLQGELSREEQDLVTRLNNEIAILKRIVQRKEEGTALFDLSQQVAVHQQERQSLEREISSLRDAVGMIVPLLGVVESVVDHQDSIVSHSILGQSHASLDGSFSSRLVGGGAFDSPGVVARSHAKSAYHHLLGLLSEIREELVAVLSESAAPRESEASVHSTPWKDKFMNPLRRLQKSVMQQLKTDQEIFGLARSGGTSLPQAYERAYSPPLEWSEDGKATVRHTVQDHPLNQPRDVGLSKDRPQSLELSPDKEIVSLERRDFQGTEANALLDLPQMTLDRGEMHSSRMKSNDLPDSYTRRTRLLLAQSSESVVGSRVKGNTDGFSSRACFNLPWDVVCDVAGSTLYIADYGNGMIRKLVINEGMVFTVAHRASGKAGLRLCNPTGLALDSENKHLYVCDAGASKRAVQRGGKRGGSSRGGGAGRVGSSDGGGGSRSLKGQAPDTQVFVVNVKTGGLTALKILFPAQMHAPAFTDILLDERDNLYLAHSRGIVVVNAVSRAIMKTVGRKEQGFADGSLRKAAFRNPHGMCWIAPQVMLVADTMNHCLRKIDFHSEMVETFVGSGVEGFKDGDSLSCQFRYPQKLDSDPVNGVVFVSDLNDCIRVVEVDSRQVFSLSRLVPFDAPHGLVWAQHGRSLYICDSNHHCLRRVTFRPPHDASSPEEGSS